MAVPVRLIKFHKRFAAPVPQAAAPELAFLSSPVLIESSCWLDLKDMPARHKILLLDDDQDLLEVYREMLSKLPSAPEVRVAHSGARAIALLESEPFSLLVSDLNMPKMDGLQVLTIVRRRFPHLRTAVMTSLTDPQFRTRAYALGIDLFLEKPNTPQEINLFTDSIESLLARDVDGGFRGVQSKSLMDIVQLECLSQSSSVLKITNGSLIGRIWFENGEVIDAEAPEMVGESAFARILAWKTGAFEILSAEPHRPRTIHSSVHGLLLDSAQALDEAQADGAVENTDNNSVTARQSGESPLLALTKFEGVEFVMTIKEDTGEEDSWGVENPERLGVWMRDTIRRLRELGDNLHTGQLNHFEGLTQQARIVVLPHGNAALCAGFNRSITVEQARETTRKMLDLWLS
jgi:CheY-like chemotaxis protein